MMRRASCLLSLVWIISSCASPLKTRELRLAKGVRIDLPPLASFGQIVASTHQVEVQNKGRTYRFSAQVEIDADRLVMVGLTPVGSRAFSLIYDGANLTYESLPFFNLPLAPDRFLLAYILIVWPQHELEKHLAKTQVKFEENGPNREMVLGGSPIIRFFQEGASYRKGGVTLQHLQEGYWLKVQTLQWQVFKD